MKTKLKGTIRPRGNRFEFVIDMGKDPVTGKRIQKTGVRNTEEECRIELLELNRSLAQGQKMDGSTLGEFILSFHENQVKHKIRPSSYGTTMAHVTHIVNIIGHKKLNKIDHDDIEYLYSKLLEMGLSKGYITNVAATLRKTFKYAKVKRRIIHDVASEVPVYTYKTPRMKVWLPDQVKTFMRGLERDQHPRYLFYALQFSTGMRIGEITGLHPSDIMPLHNQITINKSVKHINGVGYVLDNETKTDNSVRTIEIPKRLHDLLLEHIKHDEQFVFHENGDFMQPSTVRKRFKRDAAAYGLPIIRFHDTRHTVATMLLSKGRPVVMVAELLGDTVQTVQNTYSHVIPKMRADVVSLIEEEFL